MQFKHILYATDFSAPSRALAGEVEWLANRFQATVSLLHVLEIPSLWYSGAEAGVAVVSTFDFAEEAKARLTALPLDIPENRLRRVLFQGNAAAQIEEYVRDHAVDLIVMGTHGHGPLRTMLCGSVLGKILHDTECPVWTAAFSSGVCRGNPVVSKILCGLELTEEAAPLLGEVQTLASAFSAQVRIVHATGGAETRPNKYFEFDLQQFLSDAARVEIGKLQRCTGTDYPVSIGSGSIAASIAETATEHGADLVVIGRGHSQETLGALRTHAYDIIRLVPCPVLSCVVKQVRTSSSCIEVHPGQFEADGPPQIDSLPTFAARSR